MAQLAAQAALAAHRRRAAEDVRRAAEEQCQREAAAPRRRAAEEQQRLAAEQRRRRHDELMRQLHETPPPLPPIPEERTDWREELRAEPQPEEQRWQRDHAEFMQRLHAQQQRLAPQEQHSPQAEAAAPYSPNDDWVNEFEVDDALDRDDQANLEFVRRLHAVQRQLQPSQFRRADDGDDWCRAFAVYEDEELQAFTARLRPQQQRPTSGGRRQVQVTARCANLSQGDTICMGAAGLVLDQTVLLMRLPSLLWNGQVAKDAAPQRAPGTAQQGTAQQTAGSAGMSAPPQPPAQSAAADVRPPTGAGSGSGQRRRSRRGGAALRRFRSGSASLLCSASTPADLRGEGPAGMAVAGAHARAVRCH